MSTDPRSSKHYKSCQAIAAFWPLSVGLSVSINNLKKSISCFVVTNSRNIHRTWLQCMPGRVCTSRVGRRFDTRHTDINKSNTSSQFPHVDTSNAWQMGYKSQGFFFLLQELLLDFASINLTPNANKLILYQLHLEFQNIFYFFKMWWWFTSLSRFYDASQPPGRHTRYLKTMVKILVDRALMHHISFVWRHFLCCYNRFTCCASHHNNLSKRSVPRFLLYMLFAFDLKWLKRQLRFCGIWFWLHTL